jgi:excinuclease UvrABC nuclease subunit
MQRGDLARFKLPDEPGVYFFKKGKRILYIGKATSLRDRVRSYFAADLVAARGEHIRTMVSDADALSWQTTGSVLEALILEAALIKRHQPPANAMAKDNKSFNYLIITKEDFPRVLVIRGRDLFQKFGFTKPKYVFGPFPHGLQLQEAMKIVRRIFPYRDTCTPCEALAKQGKTCKPCFNRQIGLCPGVCTGEVSKAEYARTVRHICELFSGNFKGLKRKLTHEMKAYAEGERYEEASRVRRQIDALTHIKDVSLIKSDVVSSGGGARIEAFDVAHTAGQETVAVMTVVRDGEAYKAAYRKFTIRTATNNDVAALKEALERRLAHAEWPLPRVFVVDGVTAQLNAARRALKAAGVVVPIVGVVKDERHKPQRLVGDLRAIQAYERDILLANAEAHRFAITWHRRRRSRAAGL